MVSKIKLSLIVCLLSFTVSSQSDSLVCFTKDQVKVFLVTKVELKNCLDSYNAIQTEFKAISEQNVQLESNLSKQKRKTRRNRIWGVTSTGIVLLLTSILLL